MPPRTPAASLPQPPQPIAPDHAAVSCKSDRSFPVSLNARRILATPRPNSPQPLSEEEYRTLLSAAEHTPMGGDMKDVVVILYHTGFSRNARPGSTSA
jgi:hypothetical protein